MANKKKKNAPDRRLYIPKDTKKYTARKLQQMIRRLENEFYAEPDKVDVKKYILALEKFEKLADEIKRDTKKRRKTRVEQPKLENSSGSGDKTDISF